ncbi:MAG: GlsB/YeaQ/YmgE family stress response membrane protein [Verrucomicrobiales bacterium]
MEFITIGKLIIWIIVGGFAGSVVGAVVRGKREGYGKWKNFGIGLVGAVIGSVIFHVFRIDLGLKNIAITFEDVVSALLGSFLLLLVMWMIGKKKGAAKKDAGA